MLPDGSDKYLGAALVVKLAISAAKMAFIAISDTDILKQFSSSYQILGGLTLQARSFLSPKPPMLNLFVP